MRPSHVGHDGTSLTVSNQSQFELPRELRLWLEEEMDACRVVSRQVRAAVRTLATFVARQWSHPDRMNGCFAMARESARPGGPAPFYEKLGLTEWLFRTARDFLVAVGFSEKVERESSDWRWTAFGPRRKADQFRFGEIARQALDDAWAAVISRARMTPAQRMFEALERRKNEVAERHLRNTELRSKGLSTIPEVRNSVASRISSPTAVSAFNREAARDGWRLEEAIRRWGLSFPGK